MTQSVLDGVKKELDERNIGGGYNTVRLMDYFEKTTNNILNRINKIDPQRGNAQTMTEREKKRHIFEGRMLHSWGGKLQGLPKHWEFPRAAFFGAIVIWHMGIGGGYNMVRLMDYFEKTTNNILNRINKIDPQRGNAQTMTEREKKRHIFEGRMLHSWGGKLQGLPKHWEFPRAAFFGGIVIWHMGSGKDNVPALKLLSSHHFNHLKRGQKKIRDLKILNEHVKKAAIETNSWRPQNDWDEMKLIFNAIKKNRAQKHKVKLRGLIS